MISTKILLIEDDQEDYLLLQKVLAKGISIAGYRRSTLQDPGNHSEELRRLLLLLAVPATPSQSQPLNEAECAKNGVKPVYPRPDRS